MEKEYDEAVAKLIKMFTNAIAKTEKPIERGLFKIALRDLQNKSKGYDRTSLISAFKDDINWVDEDPHFNESTQYDKIINESNKWMYGEDLNEATKKAKDKQVKPEEIATAIKKWVDKKKPFETTDNGTEKYEMNIEMGKPSPIGFNNNEIKKDLAKIKKSLQDKYKDKFSKVKLSTNKYYLLIDLIK